MARKPIDIGAIGNDGTGDSIRDAFRKVNDNFRELYSSLGLGDRLTFLGLDDSPETYVGFENSVLTVNSSEEGLIFRKLIAGSGVQLDFTSNQNEITISNLLSDVSLDPRPNLGGPLNVESGTIRYPIGNMLDLRSTAETSAAKTLMQTLHGIGSAAADRLAVNKGYADTKLSLDGVNAIDPDTGTPDSRFGTMNGPLILSRNPEPEDDATYDGLIAATKRYVDTSGFGSSVNLYVATSGQDDRENLDPKLQGRALPYAFRTIEAALKKAEELVLDAPLEIGPYKKKLTFGQGENDCFLQSIDFSNGVPVTPATFDLFMSSDTVELDQGGDLYLPGDRLEIIGGTAIEPIRLQVLSVNALAGQSGRGPINTFRILTTGVYSVLPGSSSLTSTATSSTGGSTFGRDATFNITYRINNIVVGSGGGSGYGLVSITFQGGGGTGAAARATVIGGVIQSVSVTNKGQSYTTKPNVIASLPRFFIFTGGQRTDFTGDLASNPAASRTRDLREGLLLKGETSGALALILSHTGALSTETGFEQSEVFDVDILKGEFELGEHISYGDVTKPVQICIFVEAGIYEENYPLKIPQNVAIIGDEFRRTIVRPRLAVPNAPLSGMSTSPWALTYFRRQPSFDGMQVTEQLFGYHYLSDPTLPAYPLFANKGDRRSAAEILQLNRAFIKDQIINWITNQIDNAEPDDLFEGFEYNSDLCKRDVGLIIDAMVFDLKYGGYSRTISAALKYFQNASSAIAISSSQLSQTQAAIERINDLAQDVIANEQITPLYTNTGIEFDPNDFNVLPYPQIIDLAYVAEPGSSETIEGLTDIIIDIIENSGAANYPKDNTKLDVFLCNDADIIRAITCQGHSGFMMVLDPEGQILTKSPYCQESACFSQSTGFKTFAGGMFVDGFTGNQRFFIESTESSGSPAQPGLIINISGLLRPPQTPCSFIVNDVIFRVNYIRNYNYGITAPEDPSATTEGGYSTAQLIMDETTPFLEIFDDIACTFSLSSGQIVITVAGGHGLQIRAFIQFKTTGTLPDGLNTFRDYYVISDGFTETTFKIAESFGVGTPIESSNTGSGTHTLRRVFEILMPGNRSMLSNDFTQINDLGYGLVTANGGLTEAVSMFTYYCQISYYSLSGGQIRSVGGSSSHGNFALVAEGSDPLEVPVSTQLYHRLSQGATVYAVGAEFVNNRGDGIIYVNYDDYRPLSGSEIEINHGNVITRYAISQVTTIDIATRLVRINISSAGGLQFGVVHGTRISIRQNSFVVLTGDVIDTATRPSTALQFQEFEFVYRVLEFAEYSNSLNPANINATLDLDDFQIISIDIATGLFTTNVPHRQRPGYQITIEKISGTLPDAIAATETTPTEIAGDVYYIIDDGLTATEFKISSSKTGLALDLSAGPAYSEVSKVRPYGLSLTQLRENYSWLSLDVFRYQPFRTPSSLISGIAVPASDWITTSTTYPIHTQISFTATSIPGGLQEERSYYVISDDFVSNTRFAISTRPPILHSQIGVGGYNPVTQRITGLRSTANMVEGQRIIAIPSITGVSAAHVGTAVTLTFSARPKPPYILGQSVSVSGFAVQPNYNGTVVITAVTTTTLSYTASSAPTGIDTGGTISTPGTYGTLPTDAVIPTGGIIGPTEIEITGTGGSPAAGTVAFNVEGERVDFTSAGSDLRFGNLIGDQGQSQIAITKLPSVQISRIFDSEFNVDGETYSILDYQNQTDYALITISSPLVTSVISYISPIALKAGVAVPSEGAIGTLTIRISLVRVTSHDFLEIGTGSYADTNYPKEIFGQSVNDFNLVPLYRTDKDEEGAVVLRSQTQERDVGRVFFVTTDQYGNFSVGPFFKVDQGTGTVTFSASIALSQLEGLGFKRGTTVSEFSTDDRLADEFNDTVPTEAAVAGFVARRLGIARDGTALANSSMIPANTGGFMPLNPPVGYSMKNNMDLGGYNIKNLAHPILDSDAARLDTIRITNLKDNDGTDLFEFTNISSGQLVALTGANNAMSNFTPVGDVVFDIQSGDSTLNVIRTDISPGVIVDADVNSSAGIDQTKLSLNNAFATTAAVILGASATGNGTTVTLTFAAQPAIPFTAGQKIVVSGFGVSGYNGTHTVTTSTVTTVSYLGTSTVASTDGTISALRGVAVFDQSQFTATDGWITVKNNGLALGKLAQISTRTVLGNSTTGAANVSAITFGTVVTDGLAVRKIQYGQNGTALGFLRRTVLAQSATEDNDSNFTTVQGDANATANTLVLRNANGDFASRYITADQFVLKVPDETNTYKALEAQKINSVSGFTNVISYNGPGGSVFAGIQIGAGTDNNRTLYNNTSHVFRSQNGNDIYGTINSTGINLGTLTVTAGAISTGAEATTGTVTGRWSLVGTSRMEATYAADLAEYYEGDAEYVVGTVLIFGGEKEVTISTVAGDRRVAGVVSDTAAYSMYGACPGLKNQIALQGRVPCLVKGKVSKGDLLVTSDTPGVAMASDDPKAGTIIGKAIENHDSDSVGTIVISVGRT